MQIAVKRVYDEAKPTDGVRVLVDRLWPRGVSKEKVAIDVWAKELAPSSKLRQWFHKNKTKNYKGFTEKYQKELLDNNHVVREYVPKRKRITLVTAVKDIENSHIPILISFLKKC